MEKKILFILITIILVCFPTNKVDAVAQMTCTYEGVLKTFCGAGGDKDNCKVKIVIELEKNKWKSPTVTWVASNTNADGCRPGDDVAACFRNPEINSDFTIVQRPKVIKNNNGKYVEITDSNYVEYFLNGDATKYKCPPEINVLRKTSDNTLAIFVSDKAFVESYCPDNKKIGEFSCEQAYEGRDSFGLTNAATTPYFGGEIETNNSSGSCCVYKSNSGGIVNVYKITSTAGNGATQYAACYGANCMTAEPNTSLVANYLDDSMSSYKKLEDCNNMPKNIWFKRDSSGNYTFYNAYFNYSNYATLQPNEYCESDVYSADGVVDNDNKTDEDSNNDIDWGDKVEVNCEGIIGQEMLDFINKIFRWIQIIAPIIVIVLGSVEFAGAILKDDRDALKKASNKFIKRLIVAVALFFIPLILSWILEIFNEITGAASSTCGIGE